VVRRSDDEERRREGGSWDWSVYTPVIGGL
jgi:hypothetical protein